MTDTDLLDYLDGLADRDAARRVIAAALRDRSVRDRLRELRELDRAASAYAEQPAAASDAERRLGEAMLRGVREYAAAAAAAAAEPARQRAGAALASELRPLLETPAGAARAAGGGLWHVAARSATALQELWDTIGGAASRAFVTGRQALSLPCLAPAAAGTSADFVLRRETVTTADGVRIEFQQLPGVLPNRLRVLVDASLMPQELRDLGYNVAFLTLEDAGSPSGGVDAAAATGDGVPAATESGSPPDRHILVVALNGEGRGFTDFLVSSVAAAPSPSVLPAPRGVCRLTGVTLSHVGGSGWSVG